MNNPWILLRSATATDTALAAATRDVSAVPDDAVVFGSRYARHIEVAAILDGADSAEGDSVAFKLYAGRDVSGPARLVCSGTFTGGAMVCNQSPDKAGNQTVSDYARWCDTLTLTSNWIKPVWKCDDDDSDGVVSLHFDPMGYKWFYFEVTTLTGATKVIAVYSYVD